MRQIDDTVGGLRYPAVSDVVRRTLARLERVRAMGNELKKLCNLRCDPETIIGFAAKQVVDRVFGGATRIVTAYHKIHFIVLARAIAESNRDAKIQESLSEAKEAY